MECYVCVFIVPHWARLGEMLLNIYVLCFARIPVHRLHWVCLHLES